MSALPQRLERTEYDASETATGPSLHLAAEETVTRSPMVQPLTVEVLDNGGFVRLRQEWDVLTSRVSAADQPSSMFMTWDWQESWWRHFGRTLGNVQLLGVRDVNGRLVGLAPLYSTRETILGQSVTTLRLIGDASGDGDDLDLLAAPGCGPAVACAVLRHLRSDPRWDLLRLGPTPSTSPIAAHLKRAALAAGWAAAREHATCARTPLPDSWGDLVSRLRPRMRSRARSLLRQEIDADGTHVSMVRSQSEIDAALDDLFRLHSLRWKTIGLPGSFADPRRRAMFLDLARRGQRRGWLRLYRLDFDGQPVAAQLGYVYDGTFLQIQEGFDPTHADRSPGVALRIDVLRRCVEEGLVAYDNLLGTPPQKMRWGAEERSVMWTTMAKPRSRGALLLTVDQSARVSYRAARKGWQSAKALTTQAKRLVGGWSANFPSSFRSDPR